MMRTRPTIRSARTVGVAASAITAWAALEWAFLRVALQEWDHVVPPGPASLDEALTLLAAAVAVLLCTWLGASTLAAVLTHLPGGVGRLADRVARAWAPPVSRRLAAVLVGATVAGALAPGTALGEAPSSVLAASAVPVPARDGVGAAPLLAAPGFLPTTAGSTPPVPGFTPTTTDGAPPAPGARPAASRLPAPASATAGDAPGWVPTRPVQRRQPSAALVVPGRARHEAATVVVHRGDTLWGIVARQLGPHATEAEVATAWPRWYAANRSVIGDDPDLVKPGQVLHAPGSQQTEAAR